MVFPSNVLFFSLKACSRFHRFTIFLKMFPSPKPPEFISLVMKYSSYYLVGLSLSFNPSPESRPSQRPCLIGRLIHFSIRRSTSPHCSPFVCNPFLAANLWLLCPSAKPSLILTSIDFSDCLSLMPAKALQILCPQ